MDETDRIIGDRKLCRPLTLETIIEQNYFSCL